MPVEVLSHRGPDPSTPAREALRRFRGRLRDSLWIAWTFTLFFDWIAFLWIGFRARSVRWLLWGVVYAIPFTALITLSENEGLYESWPGDLAAAAVLILGVVSIVHAFRVRPEYVAWRRALLAAHPSADRPRAGPGRASIGPLARLPTAASEPHTPRLRLVVVLGSLGTGIAAVLTSFNALLAAMQVELDRLPKVLGVVALGMAVAFLFCLALRANGQVQLTVQLAACLYLAAGIYAVDLERGGAGIDTGYLLVCLFVSLALCAVAAAAATLHVIETRPADRWRALVSPIVVAIALAAVPFAAALSGDPGDAPEAAVRRQLGPNAAVDCWVWERSPLSFSCSIDAEGVDSPVDCRIQLAANGDIARSEDRSALASKETEAFCRSLVR